MTAGNWIALGALTVSFAGLMWAMLAAYSGRVSRAIEGLRGAVDKDIDGIEERLRVVENEKVDKRDWIREQVSVRSKVDAIGRDVAALNAKFDASLGIGAQMKNATEAMKDVAEKVGEYLERDHG